jgi:hypothetical protein
MSLPEPLDFGNYDGIVLGSFPPGKIRKDRDEGVK